MEFRPTSSLLASLLRHAGNSTSSLDTYWLLEARLKSRCVRAIYYPAKLPSTWGRWTSRGREWPRESRPPHAYEIGPRKGMKNCWKFRRREERPSPPPPPLFSSSTLRLIKLASRSLRIGWLSKGRRRKGEEKKKKKKEKRFKQGAPKWHRADKLRYIMLDEAPTARVPTYVQRRGDVDLWRVSIIDPYIRRSKRSVSFGTDRKE